MSKQSQIRWRETDLAELRRVVKNYNAKLSRQRSKFIANDERYQASQLPKKASVRELRPAIETRRDFNTEINRMQNFITTGERFTIDQNTKKSLYATTRDFNAKIDRLAARAKTQGERAALPAKISPDELTKIAANREELKAFISDYKGFLKRGAEQLVSLPESKHNIKLTKWQKEVMDKRIMTINEARAREKALWEQTKVKYGGKEADYTQGQVRMGDPEEFTPMKLYNYSSTYSDMREKMRLVMRESQEGYWDARTELARINYTESLDRIMGEHPIGKMLLKHIKGMDLNDFKRTLKGEDDLFLLLYELEKHPDNYDVILEEIWNEWLPDKDMYEEYDSYISRKVGE